MGQDLWFRMVGQDWWVMIGGSGLVGQDRGSRIIAAGLAGQDWWGRIGGAGQTQSVCDRHRLSVIYRLSVVDTDCL